MAHSAPEPMLLVPFSEQAFAKSHMGWYMSEKYDGWRLLYKSGKFYSRAGNELEVPATFYRDICALNLPQDVVLDGELWAGRGRFNEVGSRHQGGSGAEQLRYMVFDMPSVVGGFADRMKTLKEHFARATSQLCSLTMVDHELVAQDNVKYVKAELKRVTDAGGEGLVFRRPDDSYAFGERSPYFMKYKTYDTADAIVTDYYITPTTAAKAAEIGYVSSLVCYLVDQAEQQLDDKRNFFKLTWKSTNPPAIGSVIGIKYTQYTVNGLPKFPVFLGVRDAGAESSASSSSTETKATVKAKKAPKSRSAPAATETVTATETSVIVAKRATAMTVSEKTKTLDEWDAIGGYPLHPGESLWVQSTSKTREIYKITRPKAPGAKLYCSCPAWKYQRLSPAMRVCKHTIVIQGDHDDAV